MIYKVSSLLVAMLIFLTGCASSPTTGPTPAVEKETKSEVKTVQPSGEQARPSSEQPKEVSKPVAASPGPSGTLVSLVSSFADDVLDPILGGPTNMTTLLDPMFDRLVGDDGKGGLAPQIAESWEMSADGRTWTFHLRKGVKFHNGDEVTSADVKFSLERFTSQKSRSGSAQVLRSTIDHIDTPDPYTVSVTTKDVNVRFIYSVSTLETGEGAVMPKKYIEEKGEEYFAKHPVGAGPWKFVKYEPASTLELEAVEGHYRNTPAFEKLVIKLVPEETTRVAMLKRGEADIADISVDRVNEVKSAGLDVREVSLGSQPALLFSGTWMNTGQPTMDLRVRQALAYAINREEIAKQFFQGYATPAIRFKMFPVSFGWNPEWKPIPYDPNKAKALLAEAGYPDRFKDPVINMFSYKQPGAEWLPKYVEIISGYWEAVGVKTKITPMEFGAFRPMYLAKPPDPKIVGGVWFFNVPTGFETISAIEPFYSSTGSVGLLRDPEWDALAAKAAKELDEGKRVELVRQMVDRAHEQRVDILTVSVMRLYAVGNNVGPWTVFGMGQLGKLYETVKHK